MAAVDSSVAILATCTSGLEQLAALEVPRRLDNGSKRMLLSSVTVNEGHIRFRCSLNGLPALRTLRCVEQLWGVAAEHDGLLTGDASDEATQADLAALSAFGKDQGSWAVTLEAWQALRPEGLASDSRKAARTRSDMVEEESVALRFRAKCKRAESATGHTHKEHGFTSIDAASAFGGALKERFNWRVGLERGAYDLDIRLAISGRSCRALLLLTTTLSSGDGAGGSLAPSRSNLSLSRTALRPTIASAMAQLRCLADGAGNGVESGCVGTEQAEIVVDPMCGGGSIGCEVAAGWPGAFVLNGDVEKKEADRLANNLNSLRRRLPTKLAECSASSTTVSWAARMEGARWDATRLPLRSGVVDSIVTDLPWGKV
eukprot:COSAG02_NODE_3650_length_6422_cov_15.219516_4_plen_373_part_00